MAGVPGPRLGAGGRGDARQDRGRPSQCHRSLAGDCLRPRVSLRRRAPAAGVGAIATRRGGGRVMAGPLKIAARSEEHASELQSLMRISYAVFCLTKKNKNTTLQSKKRKYDTMNIRYKQ